MTDPRPRNNQGQFAPDEQGGMDPNTTSAAYNPQIIAARKATLAEKLRRAIGIRRGVEESVPQEQRVLSRFNHGGHGEHGGVKEFAEYKPSKEAEALKEASLVYNKFLGDSSDWRAASESDKGLRLRRDHEIASNLVRQRGIDSQLHLPFGIGKKAKAWKQYNKDMDWVNSHLSAKLRLRELADISIGTAKKVLREIRAGNPGLRIFRPESSPMMAQYISPHTSKKMIKAAREQLVDLHGRDFKLAPNSMIVPRDVARRDPDLKEHVEDMKKMVLSSIPKKSVPIQQAAYKKAESLNSPVGLALHEAGHATMPEGVSKKMSKLQQAAARNGGISMTDPYFKTGIDEEYRANREVLNKIKQHGTPQEADSWRKRSQDQIKIGYRAPVFNAAMMQEASPEELKKAMAGLTPLSLKRRVLQKYPHIRKQQLSAKLRLRELALARDPQTGELKEKGSALGTAAKVGLGTVGAAGAVVSGTRGYHAIKTVREVGKGSFRDGLSRIQRAHDFVGDKTVSALNKKASASAKAGWMGKFGKAGDFMAGNIFTKSMFSAKLRLRELAQGFAIPPEIAAPIMARRQELMKNPDYANVQGYLVKKDNQHIMESVLKRGGRPNIRDGQVVSAYFPGKKDLSAKLRLRELARQAVYDPYAMQAQPAEPGQAGRNFRNAAIGIGALGAGGGVAYAGFRGAQAAQSARALTDDALKTSAEARKGVRSARVATAQFRKGFRRAGKAIKTQLTTFPTFRRAGAGIAGLAAAVPLGKPKFTRAKIRMTPSGQQYSIKFGANLGRLKELAVKSDEWRTGGYVIPAPKGDLPMPSRTQLPNS